MQSYFGSGKPKVYVSNKFESQKTKGEIDFRSMIGRSEYTFPNGIDVSVVCGPGTHGARSGLFEVAIIANSTGTLLPVDEFDGDTVSSGLTENQVEELIEKYSKITPIELNELCEREQKIWWAEN